MKTKKDLFELIAQATEENSKDSLTWFFNFAGHVDKMRISFYFCGWEIGKDNPQTIEQNFTDEGIQALYWFIQTRLTKINTYN